MDQHQHEWDLVEQAQPASPKPFGFVCGCGELAVERFRTLREAMQAARAHVQRLAHRPAA